MFWLFGLGFFGFGVLGSLCWVQTQDLHVLSKHPNTELHPKLLKFLLKLFKVAPNCFGHRTLQNKNL
jgi:hypothetical protein